MDAWSKVGPESNLNLKGKRGEKMGFFFSNFWQIPVVAREVS